MSGHGIRVTHNFETAHRLPHLGGKCSNLHGHSWWTRVWVTSSSLSESGTVVEFAPFKAELRSWIDTYLDHGAMLGRADPLGPVLENEGSKLLTFGAKIEPGDAWTMDASDRADAHELAEDLDWPTVENVAVLLARVATRALTMLPAAPGAVVSRVEVRETAVNAAEWTWS